MFGIRIYLPVKISDIWFVCKIDIFQFVIIIFDEVQRARYYFLLYIGSRARTSIYIGIIGYFMFAHIQTPQQNNRCSWQITAYRRFAKFGRKQCIRIRSIPSGLQPVATMRWWQMYNLSEVDDFIGWLRFLPIDSDLKAWKKRGI